MQTNKKLTQFLHTYQGQRAHLIGPMCSQFNLMPASDEPIIFIDGGSRLKSDCPYPNICVGDGDSTAISMDITLNPNKPYSDLTYVLHHLKTTSHHLHLHGFLGGRRDHEYFNLGEVYNTLNTKAKIRYAQFDNSVFIISKGIWELQIEGIFSLASLQPTLVQLRGDCEYKIKSAQRIMPLNSYCLSNVGRGQIQIFCEKPLIIFLTDTTKFGIIHALPYVD